MSIQPQFAPYYTSNNKKFPLYFDDSNVNNEKNECILPHVSREIIKSFFKAFDENNDPLSSSLELKRNINNTFEIYREISFSLSEIDKIKSACQIILLEKKFDDDKSTAKLLKYLNSRTKHLINILDTTSVKLNITTITISY
ncbi:MAG TPA: hypothetical protein VGP47_07980 [Parachlamydiaceae bacterium]|nr:hypothetical protein [Parachlamydiaceae bacterium]